MVATLKLHLKKPKISESMLKKLDVGKLESNIVKVQLSQLVQVGLVVAQHSTFTNVVDCGITCSAAETAFGYRRITRLPWISEATLDVIEQHRAARLTGTCQDIAASTMTDGDLYGTITKCGSTALHARVKTI